MKIGQILIFAKKKTTSMEKKDLHTFFLFTCSSSSFLMRPFATNLRSDYKKMLKQFGASAEMIVVCSN